MWLWLLKASSRLPAALATATAGRDLGLAAGIRGTGVRGAGWAEGVRGAAAAAATSRLAFEYNALQTGYIARPRCQTSRMNSG